ncbi:MAG: 6-hydroxymethylpterin diphosphokinase MptE-like protein [bacterium]
MSIKKEKITAPLRKYVIYHFIRKILKDPLWWWAKHFENKKLRLMKDIHKDRKRCFIIGNGPSINHHDLTKLKDEITFVTNGFVLHKEYKRIDPSYYCITDCKLFSDGDFSMLFRAIADSDLDTKIFFPLGSRKQIKQNAILKQDSVLFLDFVHRPIWEINKINLDITKGVYSGETIIIHFCLPLAYYMGFETIYLLGCDCNLGQCTTETKKDRHFYKNSEHIGSEQTDEYHKTYWLNRVITSYRIAKEAFEAAGRKIYNAGYNGQLEVFERVNYEDLVQ